MEDIKNTPFNEEMSERVDRFLRKEMSDAESKAFAEEVRTNPELREYYQRQFSLMRGVKIHEMRELMRAKEVELSTKRPEPARWWETFFSPTKDRIPGPAQASQSGGAVVLKRFKYAYAAIAVAAAMVCGVFIWDGSVTKSVGQEMYSVVMRDGSDIDEFVKNGDYQKAIDLIDEELGKTYELGDDPEAIAAYTQEMNDLKYRKALVYLKMGKKRAAKAILKELNDERSKEVLDKLLW